jgi:Predicted Fe-S-cluster redox enzyme
VSLSTCGLVEEMDRLAQERLGLTLSVSLHAPDDETRSAMMPINRKWPIDQLLAACKRYFDMTGRRISFEYTLVRDCNDSAATAQALADRLKGMNCHVNLIALNQVPGRASARSDAGVMRRFQQVLEQNGITATFRREQGGDIAAACGQLRRAAAEKPQAAKK